MTPQAIMLQVFLKRDAHTRSVVSVENGKGVQNTSNSGMRDWSGSRSFPAFHWHGARVGQRSRSADSLSISSSLASISDERGSVSQSRDGEECVIVQEEGHLTELARARLKV